MIVLVSGGSGFIGKAVVAELGLHGHAALVYDRPDDICDAERVAACVDGCDAVIHLAGMLGTHELFDDPLGAVNVNIGGTVHVLDACVTAGAAYVGITMPPVFPSIYTATKIGAAAIEDAYRHNYGLNIAKVRAFNAYGPGQKHGPGHPQKIIPTFAVNAWNNRPIPVWGDGTQTVDLIHVDDIARMCVAAIGHNGVTFDAGTGTGLSVNDVAAMVLEWTGSTAGVEYLPMRRGEVASNIRATGEGWRQLGWRPEFHEGRLQTTVEWYSQLAARSVPA